MEMLKRKDGSTSRRGLWDNIRAAKGSGKKPTAAMLKQEKKIKDKKAKDGTNVAKSDTVRTEFNKDAELSEVKIRPGFGKTIKDIGQKLYGNDMFDSNKAKTTAGKVIRKVGNSIAKVTLTPAFVTGAPLRGAINAATRAVKNKQDLNKIPKQKMGGKVAPKMMMKKMSKKK